MKLDVEYYNKFPITLKSALLEGKVEFPDALQREYEQITVFRGVVYNTQKTKIAKSDFLSNVERNKLNPMIPADDEKIESYSCSCYIKKDMLNMCAKFPRQNRAVARGIIKDEFGPIDIDEDTTHVNLYMYDNVDPSDEFEVIEVWEKNG